jgi:hypothetical protein
LNSVRFIFIHPTLQQTPQVKVQWSQAWRRGQSKSFRDNHIPTETLDFFQDSIIRRGTHHRILLKTMGCQLLVIQPHSVDGGSSREWHEDLQQPTCVYYVS